MYLWSDTNLFTTITYQAILYWLGDISDRYITCMFFLSYTFMIYIETGQSLPANTGHSPSSVSMLAHRLRRWPNIGTALDECPVFAEWHLTVGNRLIDIFQDSHNPLSWSEKENHLNSKTLVKQSSVIISSYKNLTWPIYLKQQLIHTLLHKQISHVWLDEIVKMSSLRTSYTNL